MHTFCKSEKNAWDPRKHMAKIYEQVTNKLRDYYENIRIQFDQTRSNNKKLATDDLVLVYFPKRQGKLTLLYRGPCRVISLETPLCLVKYLLDDSKQIVHVSRILPYRYRPGQTRSFSAPKRPMGRTDCDTVQQYYQQNIRKQGNKDNDLFTHIFEDFDDEPSFEMKPSQDRDVLEREQSIDDVLDEEKKVTFIDDDKISNIDDIMTVDDIISDNEVETGPSEVIGDNNDKNNDDGIPLRRSVRKTRTTMFDL